MSYSVITTGEVTAKEPVTTTLFTKVKDNFDNHETRIAALQLSLLTLPSIQFHLYGPQYIWGAESNLCPVRADYSMTLSGAILFVGAGGSAGTLQVDIRKSAAGGGAFSTIFSTKPSVLYSAGSYAVSTNAALSVTAVAAGDIFLLDVISTMTGLTQFSLYLPHSVP